MQYPSAEESLREAAKTHPLTRIVQEYGVGWSGPGESPKAFTCPFCGRKKKAGIFIGKDGVTELLRCRSDKCGSAGKTYDVVEFIKHKTGCNRSEAFRVYLQQANLWKEPEKKSDSPASVPQEPEVVLPEVEEPPPADPPSPPTQPDDEPPAEPVKPTPLARFYMQLVLTEADREGLRVKRGLSDATITRLGFRSNQQANRSMLHGLAEEYPKGELLQAGLWKRDNETRQLRPSGQFFGWGVVGKRKAAEDDEAGARDYDEMDSGEFDWAHVSSGRCNPVLIPYFDTSGALVGLRPHKGFPKGQSPRVYIARLVEGGRVVITEGEFKAAALADVLPRWTVLAFPGIQQCKNLNAWSDLLAILKVARPTSDLVIAYDSEEKGDPKLPGYKEEFEKRFESQVWARVLAVRLDREGYGARVAVLPEAWRERGKADWDGALAQLRRAGKSEAEIRRVFEDVLSEGLHPWQFRQAKLFETEAERVIADRAALFAYENGLPWGGKKERRLAEECRRLARRCPALAGHLLVYAKAYDETPGWYYALRIPAATAEKFSRLRKEAEGREELAALDLLLQGKPVNVAPFRMTPYYVLIKPNGLRERLVRMVNLRGEDSGLVSLPAKDFTAPRDWRQWLANAGNYGWEGGERELQTLQRDTNFRLARRTVRQLVCYGCERPGGLWYFDDCALGAGITVLPDRERIFWHQGQGSTFVRNEDGQMLGDENQAFRLTDIPRMHPGMGLRCVQGDEFGLAKGEDDVEALQQLCGEIAQRLRDSFSGYDGWLFLASMVGYAAAPEIYQARGEFPNPWIVGEKGSGKTVTARVGMALWGYAQLDQALSFKSSTTVNAIVALSQSANMPSWGDEYKEDQLKEPLIRNIIHASYNREIPGKYSPDGTTRKIRTGFMVTGETTCANAATMDRFVTIVSAKENWVGTTEEKQARFKWLLRQRPVAFTIVRHVLRHRALFVETLQATLAQWEQKVELATAEPRGRFGHGVALGALRGLVRLLPFLPPSDLERFEAWLVQRTMQASRDVAQQVNVNQWLSDLVSAVKSGAFGHTPGELRRIFKVRVNAKGAPPLTALQLKLGGENVRYAWRSYLFYFQPGPVLDMMRRHYQARGQKLPLDQKDLRAQLRARVFWVEPPEHSSMHRQVFTEGNSGECCWCFDVDKIPDLGLCPVSDEQFTASQQSEEVPGTLIASDEWVDPRKGDLFYLLHQLMKKTTTEE